MANVELDANGQPLGLQALIDDTIKGLLRSLGDAGDSPANQTGKTVLSFFNEIYYAFGQAFQPYSNYGASTAAALTVSLTPTDSRAGRLHVAVWVKSSAAADFKVQVSRDDTNWRDVDTISLAGAGEQYKIYDNAYPYVRVTTSVANDNEIEICATR